MLRNPRDKTDNAKTLRSGKDKGDLAGANGRPTSIVGRQPGRSITGQSKDLKLDDNITLPAENRGKSKTQATITSFLAGGAQGSETTFLTPTSGGEQISTESTHGGASSEKSGKERSSQPGVIRSDSCMMEKSQEPPPAQQHVPEIQGGDLSNIKQTRGSAKEQGRPQSLRESDKSNGKEMKILDWSKDTGDKLYSLTEESEFSSAEGHSLSDSGSSISSEEGNASSNNKLTVRQRRRQRKCTKIRSGSQEGTELSASSGSKTLKWDYSSINLTDVARTTNKSNMGDQQLPGSSDRGDNIEVARSDICAANTDSGMLQSIFNSIKEFQTETRIESRRARVATKRLQGSVRKVVKSCTEIETKLCTMEEKIVEVEEEAEYARAIVYSTSKGKCYKEKMVILNHTENNCQQKQCYKATRSEHFLNLNKLRTRSSPRGQECPKGKISPLRTGRSQIKTVWRKPQAETR
ncbi:hypothetical protein NDU88_000975 [Pleurodeles waltl]|uniref:Uncharacterized protein n=1 Tax=Pleurodeles waltl TaxID=8319 RepID=A0AAV7NDG8_PLEWA|nr:hypothetical protein NDU88_000975 [Pleurodeles waltl]